MADNVKFKYLIVGNSAGGISAAEAIRQADAWGTIAMVSDEPYPAYSRPMISDFLAGKCTLEKMLYRPADFYSRNNIQTFLGRKAERVDVAARTVELDSGERIVWDKLLLAVGGLPIVPQIKGADRSGVFTFTTLDDAKAIDKFLSRFRNSITRAVVIGGGLIGVSAAEGLVKRGVRVTVVEMKDRVLNTILDDKASALEAEALTKAGVNIITGRMVAEVSSYWEDSVASVNLDDGTPIPSSLVVIAIGVRPRTELAAGAGIKVNRGIVVDRRMATSVPGVYACGDAAEAYDFVYDECRLTPIWPNAYLGGKVAGMNMAGKYAVYPGGTAMNSLKYFGLNMVSAGTVSPPDGRYEVLSKSYDGTYHKLVLKDGVIAGMIFTGNVEKAGIILNLMREKTCVESFKKELLSADFGLASLPQDLWRKWLAPFAAPVSEDARAGQESLSRS